MNLFGRPGKSKPGDTAYEGTSGAGARADHRHEREAEPDPFTLTYGPPSDSAPGDVATEGSEEAVARADHLHGREDAASGGDVTNVRILTLGTANGGGLFNQLTPAATALLGYGDTMSIVVPLATNDAAVVGIDMTDPAGSFNFLTLTVTKVADAAGVPIASGSWIVSARTMFGGPFNAVAFPTFTATADYQDWAGAPDQGLEVLADGWYQLTAQIVWAT